ncbi:MAG: hypothetical protein PHN56_00825 [Candidatus Nanoarchaeia archaeon]|nr:hypothetical protein [Candidatus Nanoarchaeia archaeon]
MKKAFILALLMLLPVGFSCYNNSVEIKSVNNLENTYAMLLIEGRYNLFSNNSFLYHSVNDSNLNIKVSNDSIIFQSLNDSTDWKNGLMDELYYLWIYNATSLSEEDIIFIKNNGCCGIYNEGQFITNNTNTCNEEIVISKKDNSGILALFMATIPFLIILVYYSKLDWKKYLAFLIGGLGWLVAFLLRLPLITQISLTQNIWLIILGSSLMSGLFEETIRFLSLKYIQFSKKNFFLFAMGWSFFEIIVIYCVNILYYLMLNQQITFINAMPGLIERFSATVLHLALTVIVLKSLNNKKLLALAMVLHIIVNIFGVILLNYNFNIWVIEIVLLLISFWVYYISNELKKGNENDKRRDSKPIKRKK